MNMLSSSNQYLRPEYLSPLPTTLDAKKSPLALLAQTCSNIGADNPNNKPIIPGLEKAKDQDKHKDKSSSSSSSTSSMSSLGSDDKSSFKPYDKKEDNDTGKKTPMSKANSPAVTVRSPSAVSTGSCGKISPSGSESGNDNSKAETSSEATSTTITSTTGSQNTLTGLGYGSSLGLDLGRLEQPSKDGLGAMSHLTSLGAYKHGLNGTLNSLANCAGCSPVPGHIPVDAATTPHSFPSSIATQSGGGPLKPGFTVGSALSPYVGYARVKTATGGTTLVPVCRDPYCTNCQFSMHSAQLSACPSGCTQCTHDRFAPQLGPGAGLHALGPSLIPGIGSGSPGGLSSQLYPHTLLPRPNVCSWMVGDTYCGKRFTTSEELLQHLRTHTNLSASDSSAAAAAAAAASLSLMSPSLSVPSTSVAAWNAACHLHYTTAASLTSPAGLRRAYPTSLSPVSSLTAARYHPYKPQLPTFPGAPLPPLPHPGLGLYYSPYGLYGQRLGPPVHP